MSPQQVQAWRASDGRLFSTCRAAAIHEGRDALLSEIQRMLGTAEIKWTAGSLTKFIDQLTEDGGVVYEALKGIHTPEVGDDDA